MSRAVGRVIDFDEGTVTFTLAAPASGDFDNGYVESAGPTITVHSNAAWTLKIDSPVTVWSGVGSIARANKPVGDLLWGKALGGPYTSILTNSGASLATGAATNGTVVPLYFRTNLAWNLDTPGNYSIQVRFTLTSP